MNKKFLSAMLFGVITIVATSMFVSCKDYDDDINGLQEQITANANNIKAIQDLLKTGVVITKVEQSGKDVVLTLSNGQTQTVKGGEDGKDADVWTIGSDNYWYKNGEKTGYLAQGPAGQDGKDGKNGVDGGYYYPGEDGYWYYVGINADGTKKDPVKQEAAGTASKWVGQGITAAQTADGVTFANIPGQEGTIFISTKLQLKALVYDPQAYYHGIQAIPLYSFQYNPIIEGLATPDLANGAEHDQSGLQQYNDNGTWKFYHNDRSTKVGEMNSVSPDFKASYFLNPENAKISDKKSDYKFVLRAGLPYTRAIAKADLSIKSVKTDAQDADGNAQVQVTFAIAKDAKNVSQIANNVVDVVALQYTDKDTVITSDFAALQRIVVTDFALNKVTEEGNTTEARTALTDFHLPLTANAAYNSAGVFLQVVYDKSIDLNKWINVHYNLNAGGDATWGGNNDKIKDYGFEIKYELIGCISGTNLTNESSHATLDANGILTPKRIGTDQTANKNIIGRRPIVRVTLVDKNSNNAIAAVGYIRVEIVAAEKKDIVLPGPYSIENPYTLACADEAILNGQKIMKWDEVEEDILAAVNLSRNEFDAKYMLDLNGAGYARQFELNAAGQYVDVIPTFGQVVPTTSDPAAHQTDVLKWTIYNQEAYDWFKKKADGTRETSKTVIVRFTPITAVDKQSMGDVYVPLTWAPNDIKTDPEVTITDANKTLTAWNTQDTYKGKTGKSDVYAHVEEATSANADIFTFYVTETTYQQDGSVVLPIAIVTKQLKDAGYNKISAAVTAADISYKFVKADAKYMEAGSAAKRTAGWYELQVVGDNTIEARIKKANNGDVDDVWQWVATINNVTGQINFRKGAGTYAEDILNYQPHTKVGAGECLTALVKMEITTPCAVAAPIPFIDTEMYVKFLRPLNEASSSVKITDADPSTYNQVVKIADLTFTDWRDYDDAKVVSTSTGAGAATSIWAFYGIQDIQPDGTAKILTNFANGGENFAPLTTTTGFDVVYSGIVLGGVAPVAATGFGTITYTRNTTTAFTNSFKVKIPVVIGYDYGKIYTYLTVEVKGTEGNSVKRF